MNASTHAIVEKWKSLHIYKTVLNFRTLILTFIIIMFRVVHFELPADDCGRAAKFYKKAFGWELTKFPMEGMEYWGVHTGEVDKKNMPKDKGYINGGLTKRGPMKLEHTTVVMTVPAIGPAIKKAEKAGAKLVMEKTNVGGMGWYAKVTDTEGNVIGLWQEIAKKK